MDAPSAQVGEMSKALAEAGIYPTELRAISTSLEQFFLEVTEEDES